ERRVVELPLVLQPLVHRLPRLSQGRSGRTRARLLPRATLRIGRRIRNRGVTHARHRSRCLGVLPWTIEQPANYRVGRTSWPPPGTRTPFPRRCGRAPDAGLRPVFMVTTV